jgi:putative ATP-dependent endonuclease of OLD family
MYLAQVRLWNFRKFGSDSFDLQKPDLDLRFTKGLNVLIGENDSGKTAIIDAIKLVLKTHSYEWIGVSEEDFFNKSQQFRIELVFDKLSDEEAKNFTEWLGWNGTGETAEPYLRLIYDVKRNFERVLPSEVRAGTDKEGYSLSPEAKEYLKVTYLKPLRDAKAELVSKKNSRLSQILQGHEAFKGKKEHSLIDAFKHFNTTVERYFKGKAPIEEGKPDEDHTDKKGKALKDQIDEYIRSFFDTLKETELRVAAGEDLKTILEKLELSIKSEINPGLGTLNRLFMAGELVHLKKSDWHGLRLGIIEELEAHLHPQAQMQVIESLQKHLDIQLILTTHSPNLASKVKLEHLIICTNGEAFSMGMASAGVSYTMLEEPDHKFLEKFLDVTKSNLFFARGVILVEGWSEEILLPALAKKIGRNLTEKKVSIINIGNTGLLRFSKIFLRKDEKVMKIPVSVVTDIDILPFEAKPMKPDEQDRRKKGTVLYSDQEIKDLIKTRKESLIKTYKSGSNDVYCSPEWTLEWCLYKSKSLGPSFKEEVKKIHSGTEWDVDFEKELIEKLTDKSLNKAEIAYRLADDLETKSEIQIDDKDKYIQYLIDAIKHACEN